MIVTCVYVSVKPECVEAFKEASIANHNNSRMEQGNFRFDVIQMADDTTKFMLYEAYQSEEAAAAQKTTQHYALWRDTVKDMMAEPRKGVKYNFVKP